MQGEACVLNPPPTQAVSRKRLSASEPAERSSAVKKFKSAPLSQVKGRQLTRRVDDVWGHVQNSARKEDALAVLSKVLQRCEAEWPGALRSFAESCRKAAGIDRTECLLCPKMLSGLSGLPSFQGAKLTVANRKVQHEVDCLVRSELSREDAKRLGYPIWAIGAGRKQTFLRPKSTLEGSHLWWMMQKPSSL